MKTFKEIHDELMQQTFIDTTKKAINEAIKNIANRLSEDLPDGDSHRPYYNDVGELIVPNSITLPSGWQAYIPPGTKHAYTWDPKMYGHNNTGDYDWLQGMQPKLPEISCECGTTKTLGETGDHWEAHSQWCNCFKEKRIK